MFLLSPYLGLGCLGYRIIFSILHSPYYLSTPRPLLSMTKVLPISTHSPLYSYIVQISLLSENFKIKLNPAKKNLTQGVRGSQVNIPFQKIKNLIKNLNIKIKLQFFTSMDNISIVKRHYWVSTFCKQYPTLKSKNSVTKSNPKNLSILQVLLKKKFPKYIKDSNSLFPNPSKVQWNVTDLM